MAVATTARTTLGRRPLDPTSVPTPTTIARYAAVAKAARTPTTTVLRMTMSTSYRRYLKIAMAAAAGTPAMATASNMAPITSVVRLGPKKMNANEIGRNDAAYTNHRI